VTDERRVNVLLVDDRPENLLALEQILESLDQNLVTATSGEEALKCLLNDEFAVILLDVQMPGMDGFETAARIKQHPRSRDTPIIFLTAISRALHHHLRGYEVGAVDYLEKPFDPWILRSKVAVLIDLYEKNRLLAERTIELERSNAELEEFALAAGHDLRAPLTVISGCLEVAMLRAKGLLDDDFERVLNRAAQASTRMNVLLRNLLTYALAGTEGGSLHPVECEEVLEDAIANLQTDVEESAAEITHGRVPTVFGDATQLTQLFQNLIENALKYHSDDPPRVRVEAEEADGSWLFSVHDNGIGVDPADVDEIFTLFGRATGGRGYGGSGIGLATCKKIVERHGGRIWAEPRSGGATFCFTLPAVE